MRHSLKLRLGQRLQMTPQLQQAIRMLQMSTLELSLELQQKLEENPFLDLLEEPAEEEEEAAERPEPEAEPPAEDAPLSFEAEQGETEPPPDYFDEESGADYPSAAPPRTRNDLEQHDSLEACGNAPQNLRELLHAQAALIPFSGSDRLIADTLIECIDDRGYLDATLEEVQALLAGELGAAPEEIETVLHQLQNLEPAGVGARDPRECLLLQLNALDPATPGLETALALVDRHLAQLADKEYDRLCRLLRVDRDRLREAVTLIRSLNPHPGLTAAPGDTGYIVPDVVALRHGERWVAKLNPQALPRLVVNRDYQALMRRVAGGVNGGLKAQLQEARWLLGSLEKRQQTMLLVAQAIVRRQQGYLDHGDRALRPMVLRDIAEELEIHESTVSRATTGKYMLTPRGVVELRHFFSSQVKTSNGGTASATAIQSLIRQLVEEEPLDKPISDSKISLLLRERGFQVARRTVAKYREQMQIPPSNRRRRL